VAFEDFGFTYAFSFGEYCISFADISKLSMTLPDRVFPKAYADVVISDLRTRSRGRRGGSIAVAYL